MTRYIEIPTNLKEDRWVQALEVRPGNRAVVHHVIVYARTPQPERRPSAFRPAQGMEIPAGQSGGQEEPEGQKLYAGAEPLPGSPPSRAVDWRVCSRHVGGCLRTRNGDVAQSRNDAGSADALHAERDGDDGSHARGDQVRVCTAEGRVASHGAPQWHPQDSGRGARLLTGRGNDHDRRRHPAPDPPAHAPPRKELGYTITYPDGRNEVILSVPKYDFNWQTSYVFAEPLKLPKGTKLRAVAHYDNSTANNSNPDPTVDVHWGDQTWEEMMFSSVVYSIDGVTPGAVITAASNGGGQER